MSPPIRSAIWRQMARPKPAPAPSRPAFPVLNGSKMVAAAASGTPGPLSSTVRITWPSARLSIRAETPPVKVNFSALPIRLFSSCFSRIPSAWTKGMARSVRTLSVRAFSSARARHRASMSKATADKSSGSSSRVSIPAEARDMSRASVSSRSRLWPESITVRT